MKRFFYTYAYEMTRVFIFASVILDVLLFFMSWAFGRTDVFITSILIYIAILILDNRLDTVSYLELRDHYKNLSDETK